MDLGITTKMVVREAMSSPVISVNEDQNIVEASKIMSNQRIGSIVVIDNDEKPLGILTERDLVYRIVAKDVVPREIAVKKVMSSPLKMVDSDMTLEEAMRVMGRENIRRLGVTYKGKLEGIITDKDILWLMPTLIEIIRERSRIQGNSTPRGPSFVGYCTRCEAYSNNLRNLDGELLCEDCMADEK
jgi:CBS domain-containing protein